MSNEQLISSITEFAASQKLDRPKVIQMLRDALQGLIQKKFGKQSEYDVIIDPKKGDLQIFRYRTIVADDAEDAHEEYNITLTEAQKIEADFEIGEQVAQEVSLDIFNNRRAIREILQLLTQEKDSLERDRLYETYTRQLGKIISAEVGYISPKYSLLYDNARNELILPRSKQIPGERMRRGMHVKAIIEKVEKRDRKVSIVLDRTSNEFLNQLMHLEIDEITQQFVLIKGIARIPGLRAKIAVQSQDDRIDAAGSCIGRGGQRVQSISREHLNNERLDIINYTDKLPIFIKRITNVERQLKIKETPTSITLYSSPDQVPTLSQNIPFLTQLLNRRIYIEEVSPGLS